MRKPICFLTGLLLPACMTAQDIGNGSSVPHADERVKHCERRLRGGESAEALLLDTNLADLHPHSAFRSLIASHPAEGTITMVLEKEAGERITVVGRVIGSNGRPVGGALVYAYQTDARGWYAACCPHILVNSGDHKHARLFAYVRTRTDGTFELNTIMPSGYPNSDLPAHIHVHVVAGELAGGTELQFADDPRMDAERRERSAREHYLVSERMKGRHWPEYHYTLTID